MKESDFLKVENFKEKMSNKIYNSIQDKVNKSSLVIIAVASNIFERGFGKSKLENIFQTVNITEINNKIEKINLLNNKESIVEKNKLLDEINKIPNMGKYHLLSF